MNTGLSERFVDALISDGWLRNPADLLASLRHPLGRSVRPSEENVAGILRSMSDDDAISVISTVQDVTYFAALNLIDAGCKNAGVSIRLTDGATEVDPTSDGVPLHEIYRSQVDPGGNLRTAS